MIEVTMLRDAFRIVCQHVGCCLRLHEPRFLSIRRRDRIERETSRRSRALGPQTQYSGRGTLGYFCFASSGTFFFTFSTFGIATFTT